MGNISHFPPLRPPAAANDATEGPMRVFMFKGKGKRQYALSCDPSGRNIPRGAFGASVWTLVRTVDLVVGEVRQGFDPDEAARGIREDGYAMIGSPFNAD